MGGKKKGEEVGTKAKKKIENKIIEDKTFGLKNKNKSKVVQNYVKSVENQVKHGNERGGAGARVAAEHEAKKKKKSDEAAAALLKSLFAAQALAKDKKGNALASEDTKKVDFYKDPRMGTPDMPDTIITCRLFLDAVENELYGWRWECPNGCKCGYRHCLPEGYVLIPKKERDAQKKLDEERAKEANAKTLEEQIEEERAALKSDGLTPVTKETFFAWKERRAKRKQEQLEEKLRQDEMEKAMGKKKGGGAGGGGKNSIMNGRALFTYNPDLFKDNEDDITKKPTATKDEEAKQADDDDGQIKEKTEVDESLFQDENADEDEDVDFD